MNTTPHDTTPHASPEHTPPTTPPPAPTPPLSSTAENGKTLGIVGFIMAFIFAPVGLGLSIGGVLQSKKAGQTNGLGLAGIYVGGAFTAFWVLMIGAMIYVYITVPQYGSERYYPTHTCDYGETYGCRYE